MSAQRLAPDVSRYDHVLGPGTALVTLIEYGDFECQYCGAAYPILKRVQERLRGKLRFVFRHFPIAGAHPHAVHAAEASESVAAQVGNNPFWAMHDLLFEHQARLDDRSLARYAEQAGADGEEVTADLESGRYSDVVRESLLTGARAGVNGTPTLFIDRIRYDGLLDEEALVAALTLVAEESRVVG
jgi:protein-disulfide isomerase